MMPRKVRISHYTVKVVSEEPDINARSNEAQTDLLGQMDLRHGVLAIRPGLSPDLEADTLMHELLHGVMYVSGLQHDLTGDVEESVVNKMAPLLLDTLRRNPALCRYLGISK